MDIFSGAGTLITTTANEYKQRLFYPVKMNPISILYILYSIYFYYIEISLTKDDGSNEDIAAKIEQLKMMIGQLSSAFSNGKIARNRITSVSYTHLDVYKRQLHACATPPHTRTHIYYIYCNNTYICIFVQGGMFVNI